MFCMIGPNMVKLIRHFIKEKIESTFTFTAFVTGSNLLADALTKGLQRPTFYSYVSKLGMIHIFEPA